MMTNKRSVEKTVRDIRRRTRKKYSAEEKIRIVIEGLRGEDSVAVILVSRANPAAALALLKTCANIRIKPRHNPKSTLNICYDYGLRAP